METSRRIAAVCLLPGKAFATTGISALGALQDAFVVGLIGFGVVLVLCLAPAISRRTRPKSRKLIVVVSVVSGIYLVVANVVYYLADPSMLLAALFAAIFSTALLATCLLVTARGPRALALSAVAALILLSAYLEPRAVALQDRVYVDNSENLGLVEFSVPGYWRVMELADGKRFLNLSEYVRTNAVFNDGRTRFKSPAAFEPVSGSPRGGVHAVREPSLTRGAWGWNSRSTKVLSIPIFGTVEISRYEMRTAGEALLLSDGAVIDARFLFEAVSEHARDADRHAIEAWINELLELGCDADYADSGSGWSTLMRAIRHQSSAVVGKILDAGADPNYVNPRDGTSALHVGVLTSPAKIRLLLDHGANPRATNRRGLTPAQVLGRFMERRTAGGETRARASESAARAILALLEQKGARTVRPSA